MRIVALEEHFNVPSLARRIDPDAIARFGFPPGFGEPLADKLSDLGALRLSEMDEAGITVHVLSTSGPGAYLLARAEGVAFARDINDVLAKAISSHPDRFEGFAHLPMNSPQAAADELERSVRELGFCGDLGQWRHRRSLSRRSALRADPGTSRSARCADLPASRSAAARGL
jgi:uncharacterized protein